MATEVFSEELEDSLARFIDDFLLPIYEDGRVESLEVLPLYYGFFAYRIDEVFSRAPNELQNRLRSVLSVSDSGEPEIDSEGIWNRLLETGIDFSFYDRRAILRWLELDDNLFQGEIKSNVHRPFTEKMNLFTSFKDMFAEMFGSAKDITPPVKGEYCAEREDPATNKQPGNVSDNLIDTEQQKNVVKEVECNTVSGGDIKDLASRLNNEADKILEMAEECLDSDSVRFAFDEYRVIGGEKVLLIDETPGDVWFIGDLHSDLLAFEEAIAYIDSIAPEAKIVFLGDLFDDEIYNCEILLRIFELVSKNPHRFCFIAGNHDEGMFRSGDEFGSSVSPANLVDLLNDPEQQIPYGQRLGDLTIRFFSHAPRAAFFPNGLLATHGGFPLSDLWENLTKIDDLGSERCLQDFVWTRAHPRAPRKHPNRSSRGCQYGYRDFEGFCEHMTTALKVPVRMMIRGHDHVEERFVFFDKYVKNPVLTINTITRKLGREIFGDFPRMPSVAKYVADGLPEVHRLKISHQVISDVYGPLREENASGSVEVL